jgi:uncharacterized protein YdhG (YjbR/CyaY superfamily)
MKKKQFTTVDEYINTCPEDVQIILEKIRQTIRKTAPEAVETISYQIPAFNLSGKYRVYFAAWKDHVAMYPIPASADTFKKELSPYLHGKGTIQFPLDKPIPYDLVEKIVKSRMKQNLERQNN